MKVILYALLASVATAFAPQSSVRPTTHLNENFGLGIGEDSYENQVDLLAGEANYKQWVNRVNENNMLNRKYNAVRRVRELDLLKATADNGILTKLEAQGVDLETIEKLLPLAEQYGLLSLAGSNQQLIVNLIAPLLVEGAPLLLPVVAGALGVGPPAFYLAAVAFGGTEALLVANDVEVPLIGLPAGVLAGLLLVPLTVVSAGAGYVLSQAKK